MKYIFLGLAVSAFSPAAANGVSVFGLEIEKQFADFPECETEQIGSLTAYKITQRQSCWRPDGSSAAGHLRRVRISFNYAERPSILSTGELVIELDNDLVEAIYFSTGKLSGQAVVMRALVSKFGKPMTHHVTPLQNAYGARFQAIDAHWAIGSVNVDYDADSDDDNTGQVSVTSKFARDIQRQTAAEQTDERRPF